MRKLLRANVSRLLRDRAFWLLAALMAALGASMAVVNAVHARQAHIQKDKIPLALRHHNQGGLRIKSHSGLYAAQIQAFGQGPDKSRFIIHQQYAHGPYLRAEYA